MEELKQQIISPVDSAKTQSSRVVFLDALRGFTVVLMIIFHFSFDLNFFKIVEFDILKHPFWYLFPRIIVFLFLFCTGWALAIAHQSQIKWKPFLKRLVLIGSWALVISGTTYWLFPDNWIYFGTLHAIFVISLMSMPFLKRPNICLALALFLFIPSIFFDLNLPWLHLEHHSWDYISPFPWVGASFLGIWASTKLARIPWNQSDKMQSNIVKSLNYLGHHSLIIYLLHQPILFALFNLYLKLNPLRPQ
jgi:uncharacterized membrane protein